MQIQLESSFDKNTIIGVSHLHDTHSLSCIDGCDIPKSNRCKDSKNEVKAHHLKESEINNVSEEVKKNFWKHMPAPKQKLSGSLPISKTKSDLYPIN